MMSKQEQFLNVIDRDEAERRFRDAIDLAPLCPESVTLENALGRVLAEDVVSPVDVPSFDRSNYDGYAVRAADTVGAQEELPRQLELNSQAVTTGVVPDGRVAEGTAMAIATGGVIPRGADAVVMVEHTDCDDGRLLVRKPVAAGFGVSFAGTDVTAGETVLRGGEVLTSRETGVLAAIGVTQVAVWRQPRVAIISTGDEVIAPGEPMRPGLVYDSNARILADAVRELNGQPLLPGIVRDDLDLLRQHLHEALAAADVVLLSGGTSKGAGDLSYRVVSELTEPGIVAHGVALKPGKPICLAAHQGKPVVILPGFPTSAIFTFHEFVAPVIRALGGRSATARETVQAKLAVKVNSEIGRTEYLLVGLVQGQEGLSAYPMGKGSGSVTTFSRADGFVTIARQHEIVEAGAPVTVQLLGRDLRLADLVVIGSHCVGLDFLLGQMQQRGFHTKLLTVGSTGGLHAARRGECDVAGVHLLDPETGNYNVPFLSDEIQLQPGYRRLQGIVHRTDDPRFAGRQADEVLDDVRSGRLTGDGSITSSAESSPSGSGQSEGQDNREVAFPSPPTDCMMVNRNQGSGTRILIDRLLKGAQPPGYAVAPRSHNAVAAAVASGRADWGVAIETVARRAGLSFIPLDHEQYDFVIPKARRSRPAVEAFCRLLAEKAVQEELRQMGFDPAQ